MIKVYHGSWTEVAKPDIAFSRDNLDFGKGFYVTPVLDQAERWSLRSLRRGQKAILNTYSLDLDGAVASGYGFKDFPEYNEEWLSFITACRQGEPHAEFDVIQGGVANDKVFNTIELYYDGLIDKIETIKRLRFEKPNHQICICRQEIIGRHLHFESAAEVSDAGK